MLAPLRRNRYNHSNTTATPLLPARATLAVFFGLELRIAPLCPVMQLNAIRALTGLNLIFLCALISLKSE